MWQVLLAAAVAGSTGFVAKHFLNPNPTFCANQGSQTQKCEQKPNPNDIDVREFESPVVANDGKECGGESDCEQKAGPIFRFSSSDSSDKKFKSLKKRSGIVCRRLRYGAESDEVEKSVKRSAGLDASEGKRVSVCLKKRRTTKTKRGSSSSEDSTLFGWGLGVGIMYMMSAGQTEISKLNSAVEETSKVVQELRAELYKRKSAKDASSSKNTNSVPSQILLDRSSLENRDCNGIKVSELHMVDDVECPSSVLTEEPETAVMEMDKLEAEFESELQKLPLSTRESSDHEIIRPNLEKIDDSSKGIHELEEQNALSYQCHGVLPSELDQKLCHLLIEQQENQIVELESELHSVQSKLYEKEAELQTLKDCVRRLSSFSLSNLSDDETDAQAGHNSSSEWDDISKMRSDSRKSVVGMKRPIDSA